MSTEPAPPGAARWGDVGRAIREHRLERGLTLVALADAAGLSQPFLSQVENGRARPSMSSLHRIADGLGTTPQALFGGPRPTTIGPLLARRDQAAALPIDDGGPDAACRLLLPGDAPFHLLELDGLATEFHEHWSHDGFEAVYVLAGEVEVDLGGDLHRLGAGDTLSYPARLPHRHRSCGEGRARMLLIETVADASTRPAASSHAPLRSRRTRRAGAGHTRRG